MSEIETRLFPFRGGPLDGRSLPVPVTNNPEWSIPTVDGVWLGDRNEPLAEDLTNVDYRNESITVSATETTRNTSTRPCSTSVPRGGQIGGLCDARPRLTAMHRKFGG